MPQSLLRISDLAVNYGHIRAVRQVDMEVRAGEIVALIGANGAGKTSTLHAVSGLLRPSGGAVTFQGDLLTKLPPQAIVRRGIVLVPEGRAILTTMTVRENLEMGAYSRTDRNQVAQDLELVVTRFPILGARANLLAGKLSGGEQQMLAIGRALMAKPTLLLLDEPSMGLAPLIVQEIFGIVREVNDSGTAVLLVEQNAKQALRVAHRGYVLETGRIVLSGPCQQLLHDPSVIDAYLGG